MIEVTRVNLDNKIFVRDGLNFSFNQFINSKKVAHFKAISKNDPPLNLSPCHLHALFYR